MTKDPAKSLTRAQIVQINSICDRFERAWQSGQPVEIEALAAGADSLIRPALIQHLAELEIQFRVEQGNAVSLDDYLSRWPDLERSALKAAQDEARPAGLTSIAGPPGQPSPAQRNPAASLCSVTEFLGRIRQTRLVAEADLEALAAQSTELGSTAIAEKLAESGKLSSYQVAVLLNGKDDPLTLGEYLIQDIVGRGGMGTVYRATHRRMKRTVAIKVLRRDIPHSDLLARRFLREVEVAAKLCHPNIVTAYDAGEQNGISYLVSEFVEGQNLSELVRQYGPLSLPLAFDIVTQAARALQYAHGEGVVHRDIKPSNLLLDDSGNVKLLDVGLARISSSELSDSPENSDLTTTGMIMGTVDYMSPEQAQNTRLADERSDIYSLGCTLYFLVTGRAPYASGTTMERLIAHRELPIPSLRELSSEIPTGVDLVLQRMMAKKPSQRLASMAELVTLLETLKNTPLPDITLPLSAAGDVQGSSTGDEVSGGARTFSLGDLGRQDSATLQAGELAELCFSETAVSSLPQIAVPPAARSLPSPEKKTSTSGGLLFSAIVIPGILAVVILIALNLPPAVPPGPAAESGEVPDRLSKGPVERPPLRRLAEVSESDVAAYQKSWAESLQLPVTTTVEGVRFVLIPPGEFLFGTDAQETTLSNPFYLGETELTVAQFREFVAANDNYQTVAEREDTGWGRVGGKWVQGRGYSWKNLGENFVHDNTPAIGIAYPDAMAFCDWLSKKSGRTVRLPTAAEWEYACCCGRQVRWSFGDDPSRSDEYAWTVSNSELQIHPVRQLKPNAWGLYDMHGNEYERCLEPLATAPDYFGMGALRGGSFAATAEQSDARTSLQSPLTSPTHGGFRVILEISQDNRK